ncbi:serpin B10-like [Planococcus citri]|uniref:serpin B10-like n=1 Tax=Planococcus citri TaxID=170843 RepID=UPI0031F8B2DA
MKKSQRLIIPKRSKIHISLNLGKITIQIVHSFHKIVYRFMELVCSLTIITDRWQKSPNMKLGVHNAIFYDRKNISQEFLNDVKTYFHAELYNVSFDPTEKIILPSIEEWIAEYTTQQDYNLIGPIRDANGYLQFSMLTFTACWDTLKTSDIWDRTFRFKTTYNTVVKMRTFNSKEKIGYFNNSILKYEAIRLPFKNKEFFMIVLLPYPDQSLESIKKFSIADLYQLFEYVSANIEHIDYTIPVMMSTPVFSLNEKGASINGDTIVCDSFAARQTFNETSINYKPFYVDRPFGLLIYDERTRYILVHMWVKNPITAFSNPISYMQWNLFINNI